MNEFGKQIIIKFKIFFVYNWSMICRNANKKGIFDTDSSESRSIFFPGVNIIGIN